MRKIFYALSVLAVLVTACQGGALEKQIKKEKDRLKKEKQIKKWSKKKKEALIDGNFNLLPKMSKKTFNKKST